jgi:hypothetical protein
MVTVQLFTKDMSVDRRRERGRVELYKGGWTNQYDNKTIRFSVGFETAKAKAGSNPRYCIIKLLLYIYDVTKVAHFIRQWLS